MLQQNIENIIKNKFINNYWSLRVSDRTKNRRQYFFQSFFSLLGSKYYDSFELVLVMQNFFSMNKFFFQFFKIFFSMHSLSNYMNISIIFFNIKFLMIFWEIIQSFYPQNVSLYNRFLLASVYDVRCLRFKLIRFLQGYPTNGRRRHSAATASRANGFKKMFLRLWTTARFLRLRMSKLKFWQKKVLKIIPFYWLLKKTLTLRFFKKKQTHLEVNNALLSFGDSEERRLEQRKRFEKIRQKQSKKMKKPLKKKKEKKKVNVWG